MDYNKFRKSHFDSLYEEKKFTKYKEQFHTFVAKLDTFLNVWEGQMDIWWHQGYYSDVVFILPLKLKETNPKVLENIVKFIENFDFNDGNEGDIKNNYITITKKEEKENSILFHIVVDKNKVLEKIKL